MLRQPPVIGGVGDRCGRECAGDALGVSEGHRLFDADGSGGYAKFLQPLCDLIVGILILLPDINVGLGHGWNEGETLTQALLLKSGADGKRHALYWQHNQRRAFAVVPADAGEVIEARATGEADRDEALLRHELAGAGDAGFALCAGDRDGLGTAVFQRGDCGWKRRGSLLGMQSLAGMGE